jgi:hypothetical protein
MNDDVRHGIMGVVLLSSVAFWLCFLRIFKDQTLVIPGAISLIITVVSAIFLYRGYRYQPERKWGILVLPSAVAAVFIPFPYNTGFILLGIGFFLLLVLPKVGVWSGFSMSGLIMGIQAAAMGIYTIVIPSGHGATLLSYIVYPFLRLFGIPAAFDKGTVYIQEAGDVYPFPTTWDTLGVYPLLLILVPVLLFLLLKSETLEQAGRRAAGILGLSAVYMLFRYAVLLQYYFAGDLGTEALAKFAQIFFSPWWLFVTVIPLVVLILLLYRWELAIEFPRMGFDRVYTTISLTFLVGSLLLTGTIMAQPAGVQKEGRVLVDEIHSTWEPSSLVMDTNWYGTESTYNAYSMIEWLKVTYDVDRVMNSAFVSWEPGETITKATPDIVSDEITADILKDYDILILKTPTMYNQNEVTAIVNFVKNGGGLFVIGDHSNFAGTSTSLNEITRHFGIEFEFDSVNSSEGMLSVYKRGSITHPCAKYMPEFDFLTSCSISAPLTVGRVIPGYGLSAEPGEYASTGFFRETRRDLPVLATDRNWGIFHQCVAVEYGKGRVVAFADSTCISNFRIFFGGADQLVIGSMEWLNCRNGIPFMRLVLLVAGIVVLGAGMYVFSGSERKKRLGALMLVVCMVGLGSSLCFAVCNPDLQQGIPVRYYAWEDTVCFDRSHSSEIVNSGTLQGNYSVFLIWTQRVGLVPSVEYSLEDCTEKGKIVVIMDPVEENFSYKDIELLKHHLEKGGNVLMMVDQARVLGLNLIAEFGLDIEEIAKPQDATEEGPFVPWGPSIKGGEALKTVGDRVVLAKVRYGSGYFVLCTVSNVFRDGFNGQPGYMGYNGTDPEELGDQKEITMEIYNLEYELFQKILQ